LRKAGATHIAAQETEHTDAPWERDVQAALVTAAQAAGVETPGDLLSPAAEYMRSPIAHGSLTTA
jgi:hypothetical protein